MPPQPALLLTLLLPLLPLATAQAAPSSSADSDWAAVTALEHPPERAAKTREKVRSTVLAHLQQQENALRAFISRNPTDTRAIDARLRLAHLYTVRADFSGNPADASVSTQILDELDRIAPENRKPDVAFARLSLSMRGLALPTENDRKVVSDAVHRFQRQYPNDRRIAALLTELANLYDHHPRQKQSYLQQALVAARSPEMKARIQDDLRRLSFIGKQVPLSGAGPDGKAISLDEFKGRVVLVYFAASWSPPSIAAMEEVNYLRATFPGNRLAVIGVSLDPTPEAFATTTSRAAGGWHWIQEKRGWESPMIRNLGINALPLLWIVDKHGRLRTVNARTESENLVRTLMREN